VINTQFIGGNQFNVAVNPFTHAVYSISDLAAALAVVDGTTDRLVAQNISVGNPPSSTSVGDLPQGIAVNPFSGKIYVADFGDFLTDPEAVSHIVVLKAGEGHPWVSQR
jgi:hypothetical protein